MSDRSSARSRRNFLATSAGALMATAVATSASGMFSTASAASAATAAETATGAASIRQFRVDVPKKDLADLRRRLLATRWPTKETVPDQSQGVQLARMQNFIRYWSTGYD